MSDADAALIARVRGEIKAHGIDCEDFLAVLSALCALAERGAEAERDVNSIAEAVEGYWWPGDTALGGVQEVVRLEREHRQRIEQAEARVAALERALVWIFVSEPDQAALTICRGCGRTILVDPFDATIARWDGEHGPNCWAEPFLNAPTPRRDADGAKL